MGNEALLYEVDDHVARLTINRPERRNALTRELIGDLHDAVARAKADRDIRVLVLTGAGDQSFCAGADLSDVAGGASVMEGHDERRRLAELFAALYGLGKPTIARVRGFALAGGFGLALACDMVIASEDAQFGTPEIDVGLWPFMITVPLVRSMPPKKALELMLTGRRVRADEAERIGFVSRVVPADELDALVDELAATLAHKPPTIVKLGRDSFYRVLDMEVDDALAVLSPLLTIALMTEDSAEGRAAFLEKRPPRWKED